MKTLTTRLLDLLQRYEERAAAGTAPDLEDLCADDPDLLPALREAVPLLAGFARRYDALSTLPADGSPAAASPVAVPGFVLGDELGRGGMGVVYRAEQAALRRTVAVKMILAGHLAGPAARERFRREAEAVARLGHPGIVQVYEVGTWTAPDGSQGPYMALEYLPGGTLAGRLAGPPQPGRDAAELVRRVAEAMHHAHAAGVVHRDLKPGNVLLAEDGSPKVADFGLARLLDAADGGTRTGAVMGTPSYMAPEQARGDNRAVGPPADVWALGAILYEALTGRPPFHGADPVETLRLVRDAEPVAPTLLNPAVPRDLETVCLKCLRKEPRQRYASAQELADDLGRFLAGEPIRARPVGRLERLAKWVGRNRRLAAVGALALLALVTTAVLSVVFAVVKSHDAAEQSRLNGRLRDEVQEKETARGVAVQRRDELLRQARAAAFLGFDRAIRQAEQGDLVGGLHNFARALEIGGDQIPDLDRPIRCCLDGYARQLPRLRHVLEDLSDISRAEYFGPDGLAWTMSIDRRLTCWDTRTGERKWDRVVAEGRFNQVYPSPDGRYVAAYLAEGVTVLEAASGRPVGKALPPAAHRTTTDAPPGGFDPVAFSPDGSRVFLFVDGVGVQVIDLETGQGKTLPTQAGQPVGVSVGPRAEHLVSLVRTPAGPGLQGGVLEVWDLRRGERVGAARTVTAPATVPAHAVWAPDGEAVYYAGSPALHISLRDGTATPLTRGVGSYQRLLGATFQGRFALLGQAMNGEVSRLDPEKLTWLQMPGGNPTLRHLVPVGDELRLLLDRQDPTAPVEIATARIGAPRNAWTRAVAPLQIDHPEAVSPDGEEFFCRRGRAVLVFGLPPLGQVESPWRNDGERWTRYALDPAGERVALADAKHRVELRATRTGQSEGEPIALAEAIEQADFSADGRYLGVKTSGQVAVFEAATRRRVAVVEHPSPRLLVRGTTLFVATEQGLQVINLATGRERFRGDLAGPPGAHRLMLDATGTRGVYTKGDAGGVLSLTGEPTLTPAGFGNAPTKALDPGGRQLFLGYYDRGHRIAVTAKGPLPPPLAHRNLTGAAFLPLDRLMTEGMQPSGRTIRVWSPDGQVLLDVSVRPLTAGAAVSEDGQALLLPGSLTARTWDLATGAALDAREVVARVRRARPWPWLMSVQLLGSLDPMPAPGEAASLAELAYWDNRPRGRPALHDPVTGMALAPEEPPDDRAVPGSARLGWARLDRPIVSCQAFPYVFIPRAAPTPMPGTPAEIRRRIVRWTGTESADDGSIRWLDARRWRDLRDAAE